MIPSRSRNTIWHEINQFRLQLDRVFAGISDKTPVRASLEVSYPAVNLCECEDFIHVESELAGINLENLQISVIGQEQLLLKGAHLPRCSAEADIFCDERPYGSFERTIDLPARVDPQKIEVRLVDGILSIRMSKSPEAK